MMDPKKQAQGGMPIELSEEIAQGTYANLAIITHSTSEFIFDFVRVMPGAPKAKVQSRIVMTPEHAKYLLRALTDNVAKFESQHGEIKLPGQGQVPPLVGRVGEA